MARKITSKPSSNPRMVDLPGPKDPIAQDPSSLSKHSKGTESYMSSENQSGPGFSGIQDTQGYVVPQLKRSTPGVGVYHSEGQNRGGPATKNYDSSRVDGDPNKFDKNIGRGNSGGSGDSDSNNVNS